MAEIARVLVASQAIAASLFDKARQLLTRHWSVSSWRARADILRTAEWLIGVGNEGRGSGARLHNSPWSFGRRRQATDLGGSLR